LSLIHWIFVGLIAFIFFRRDSIYKVGNGLGRGIKGFKEGLKGEGEAPSLMRDVTPEEEVNQGKKS
jgi:Sec-independent protein translocase protein TatA